MKKLLYVIGSMILPFMASAQLQNLDFENWDEPILWDRNNPSNWICTNRWFGFPDAQFTSHFTRPVDTLSQNKKYSLRLLTFYNYMKDAAVQTAPIDYKPSALTGFYKYEENKIWDGTYWYTDTAQVVVLLTKWNTGRGKKDTIGFGVFSTASITSDYKKFQVDIQYESTDKPDSITVYLDPSIIGRDTLRQYLNLSEGGNSIFTLDNLALVNGGSTGMKDTDAPYELNVYPNPAQDVLNVGPISGEAVIVDLAGQELSEFTIENNQTIDISNLQQGYYIIKIIHNNGIYRSTFLKQ